MHFIAARIGLFYPLLRRANLAVERLQALDIVRSETGSAARIAQPLAREWLYTCFPPLLCFLQCVQRCGKEQPTIS